MIKIAMLGCDSSHTEAYTELLHDANSEFFGKARVVSLWGENQQQAKEKAALLQIELVANTPEEAIEDADVVFVSGRYGESHFYPAAIAINALKPTYVDKPFANDWKEAKALSDLAKQKNVALCSFTPLLHSKEFNALQIDLQELNGLHSVFVSGPADSTFLQTQQSKKLPFYGVHVSDLTMAICGVGITSVYALKTDKAITAMAQHKSGVHITMNFAYGVKELYDVSIYGTEKVMHCAIDSWGDFYHNTLRYLLENMRTGANSHYSLEQSCESIALLNAIELSIKTNKFVDIEIY